MSTINTSEDGTQTSHPETESTDWQAVVGDAQNMQSAIERFTANLGAIIKKDNPAESQVAKDISACTDQLTATGNAILAFAQAIAKDVDPLTQSLVSGSSADTASEITRNISAAQTAAIMALAKSAFDIANNSQGTTTDTPLSPEAQAIKDGFEKLLDGKKDPRMGFGKIPPQFLPGNNPTT